MKGLRAIRGVFGACAIYDGLLGLAFLLAHGPIYDAAGVARPNHAGYIHFIALLLVVFALMFARIAFNPVASRELMIYGVLLKIAFASVVLGHLVLGSIPMLWVPFAWLDLAWAFVFVWCYVAVAREQART